MSQKQINILAISGSLRENSSNDAVIKAAIGLAPDKVTITPYKVIGSLPHFDDSKEPSKEVLSFRDTLRKADGILICSPEYAFGVPGTLKNALDWTVSSGELVYKPLALITAATGGDKAHAALIQTFTALSAGFDDSTCLLIQFVRSKMDQNGNVTDEATLNNIWSVVTALANKIESAQKSGI